MILARLGNGEKEAMLIVLEPTNLEMLKAGFPINKRIRDLFPHVSVDLEIVIGYCPDVPFVVDQINQGVPFDEAVRSSLNREPVFVSEAEATNLKTRF